MSNQLSGKRIAFLVANVGVEQVELTSPWKAIENAGGEPVLIAPEQDTVQAMNGDIEKGDTFDPDLALDEADPGDFAALVLPGGVANPDKLRTERAAVAFVEAFVDAGKPIASICHGPWTLVEADVLDGKTLTSWPSLQTDIRNAGGTWQDKEVVTSSSNGYTLVTSRKPDDLEAFNQALVVAFSQD
jgi:protease I